MMHTMSELAPDDATAPGGAEDPDVIDSHPWRATILLGLITTAATIAFFFLVFPKMNSIPKLGDGYWLAPTDVWHIMLASHRMTSGDFFGIYEAVLAGHPSWAPPSVIQYQAGPLLPALLAPVAAIGEHFKLSEPALPYWNLRPTMWPLYATYATLLSSITFLYAVRSFAAEARVRVDLAWIQVSAIVLGFIPMVVIQGHFDDALALSFVLLSARDLHRKRWMRAAVMLGIAVGFTQWAWLALPLLLVVTPKEHRARSLLPAVLAPLAFFAVALASDWALASQALLKAIALPMFGHPALWVKPSAQFVSAGPFRLGLFVVALLIASRMWNRADMAGITAALGVTLLSRLAFEPVVFAYYAGIGLVCLLLMDQQVARGWWRWRLVPLGGAWLIWFGQHPASRPLWWGVSTAFFVAVIWPAVPRILRRPEEDEADLREGAGDDHVATTRP